MVSQATQHHSSFAHCELHPYSAYAEVTMCYIHGFVRLPNLIQTKAWSAEDHVY